MNAPVPPLASVLTAFDVDTRHGLRLVEVRVGDIANLGFEVDVLVVSAFANDYLPTATSVVGALFRRGIDIRTLAAQPAIDLRTTTGAWLSLPTRAPGIGRVLCLERRATDEPSQFIRQGLATLAIVDTVMGSGEVRRGGLTVAMPLLGTGDQGLGEEAVRALVDATRDALHRTLHLGRIVIVVRDAADGARVADRMNAWIGVTVVSTATARLGDAVRNELRAAIAEAPLDDPFWHAGLPELRQVTRTEPPVRSIEIGIHGRRFVELLVRSLLPEGELRADLYAAIERLREHKVAPWIVSYMHAVRALGNESAHAKDGAGRRPAHPSGEDAVHALFCLERLVRFALEERRASTDRNPPPRKTVLGP